MQNFGIECVCVCDIQTLYVYRERNLYGHMPNIYMSGVSVHIYVHIYVCFYVDMSVCLCLSQDHVA